MPASPLTPTTALILGYPDKSMDAAGLNMILEADVLYFGANIPSGFMNVSVIVTIPFSGMVLTQVTSLMTSISAAVRADSSSRGFVIPVGGIIMPSLTVG